MKHQFKNAYPAIPMQDQFNQPVFPQTGLSKLDVFALEIYKVFLGYEDNRHLLPETLMRVAIEDAMLFLNELEKKQNEKDTKLDILE